LEPNREKVSATSLRERHKEATRQELRAAALRLFQSKGFTQTSVDDIALAAGVSRSTFFRYFPSKESVVYGEADDNAEMFVALLRERPAGEARMEALEETLVEFAEQLDSESRRAETIVTESVVSAEPSLRARRAALIATWRENVAQVLAERDGRSEPDLEDALASAILSQMTEQMGAEWRTRRVSVTELIRNYFESLRRLVHGRS